MGTEGPNLEHRGIEELRIEESGRSGPELNLQRKITLLRVIPTMTFIFWHMFWHIFWHSIWHIF
jgi:hypothetical protein